MQGTYSYLTVPYSTVPYCTLTTLGAGLDRWWWWGPRSLTTYQGQKIYQTLEKEKETADNTYLMLTVPK